VRRQVTLPPEVDARLRELASERGQSQSQVIADALMALAAPESQLARMEAYRGIVRGGDEQPWGRQVDQIVYGGD